MLETYFFIIVILLLITGFISGMLAGFLGLGGGIIVVPVIYHLFNFLDLIMASTSFKSSKFLTIKLDSLLTG